MKLKLTQQGLSNWYQKVRTQSELLCKPLKAEDYMLQSMPNVSPAKWHLAHVTWFFETFVLIPHDASYRVFDTRFTYLFNSYYNGIGKIFPRDKRGLVSRPTVETVYDYRRHVDRALLNLLDKKPEITNLIELGLHHEQQHQELILTDLKYNFSMNPLFPAYQPFEEKLKTNSANSPTLKFYDVEGSVVEIGYDGSDFCYDNELPTHKIFLHPYRIANRLVTNGEYLEFIESGGYKNALLWLSDGWDESQRNDWSAPLYWIKEHGQWYIFTLSGQRKLDLDEPVTHVSYFEANAFATWKNMRLPTEGEWEHFVRNYKIPADNGNFMESGAYHPRVAIRGNSQAFGDVWEWTSSEYQPYPGFQALPGLLGEYNGKFMNNQKVLRGGCCVTPITHIRPSYRNFFYCKDRWPFTGIRLASDLG